jgi:Ice-binding-like/IPTL-CTERM motif
MNAQTASATRSKPVVRRAAEAITRCRRIYPALLASTGFASFLFVSAPALAVAIAPNLGAVQSYTVLGRDSIPTVGTVTCTTSTITGDVGSTANSITNTGCTIASIVAPVPASVTNAFDTAYSALNTQNSTCDTIQAGTLAGITLPPGVHCFTAGAALTGLLTLNGPPNGVWVFRIGTGGIGSLAATNFQVQMAGGGQACNVYWGTAGAATLTSSDFIGTILSGSTVTLTNGTFTGRALATTDATVTTVGGTVGFAACLATPPTVTVTKVSNGGVGAFSFTGTNGFAPQTITTVTSGVAVSGATQTLTAVGVSTTITESAPPAAFTLASITCSGLGAGGTATPVIATGTVTLDAAATAAGAAIACTFTNTFAAGGLGGGGAIPTLSEWAMIMLAALLAIAGFAAMRRYAR